MSHGVLRTRLLLFQLQHGGASAAQVTQLCTICFQIGGTAPAHPPRRLQAPQNVINVCIPTVYDPSLAPPGKHLVHAYTGGWWVWGVDAVGGEAWLGAIIGSGLSTRVRRNGPVRAAAYCVAGARRMLSPLCSGGVLLPAGSRAQPPGESLPGPLDGILPFFCSQQGCA